jgi:hypothetical protein
MGFCMKVTIFWVALPCSLVEVYLLSEVLAAFIIGAINDFYHTTRRNVPEDSYHISRRENLKPCWIVLYNSRLGLLVYQIIYTDVTFYSI